MDPTRTERIMARHIAPGKTNPDWAEAAAWRCVACFFFSFLYCSLSLPSFNSLLFLLVSLGGTKKSVLSLIIFLVCGLSSSFSFVDSLFPLILLHSWREEDRKRWRRGNRRTRKRAEACDTLVAGDFSGEFSKIWPVSLIPFDPHALSLWTALRVHFFFLLNLDLISPLQWLLGC